MCPSACAGIGRLPAPTLTGALRVDTSVDLANPVVSFGDEEVRLLSDDRRRSARPRAARPRPTGRRRRRAAAGDIDVVRSRDGVHPGRRGRRAPGEVQVTPGHRAACCFRRPCAASRHARLGYFVGEWEVRTSPVPGHAQPRDVRRPTPAGVDALSRQVEPALLEPTGAAPRAAPARAHGPGAPSTAIDATRGGSRGRALSVPLRLRARSSRSSATGRRPDRHGRRRLVPPAPSTSTWATRREQNMAESIAEMVIPGTYIEVRAEGLISVGTIATGNIGIVGTAARGPRNGRPGDRELRRGARSVRRVRLVRAPDRRRHAADADAGARAAPSGAVRSNVFAVRIANGDPVAASVAVRAAGDQGRLHASRPSTRARGGTTIALHRRQRGHRRRAGLEAHAHLRPRQGDVHRRRPSATSTAALASSTLVTVGAASNAGLGLRHGRPGEESHGRGRPSRRLSVDIADGLAALADQDGQHPARRRRRLGRRARRRRGAPRADRERGPRADRDPRRFRRRVRRVTLQR